MSKAHKHAEKMIFAAQHWHEAEWRDRNPGGEWTPWFPFTAIHCEWFPTKEYEVRLVRRTATQPRREVPAPETEAPPIGARYWPVDTLNTTEQEPCTWRGTKMEEEWLSAGLIYLNREDRDERARAMLTLEGRE